MTRYRLCDMALISVIVPVYKVELYLRQCVDSILNQTFRDFELILVDDGSPDRCGEICDEYGRSDSRVVVIHQGNGGLSAARNAGLDWMFENSKSKYVAFIDSDDWVAYNYLEELSLGCKKTSGCSSVGYRLINNDGDFAESMLDDWKVISPSDYWNGTSPCPMVAWGKLIPRNLFEHVRFPVGRIHEDEFTMPRVIFACMSIAYSSSKLYYYRVRPDSIVSRGWTRHSLDLIDAFKSQIELFERLSLRYEAKMARKRLALVYAKAIRMGVIDIDFCDRATKFLLRYGCSLKARCFAALYLLSPRWMKRHLLRVI